MLSGNNFIDLLKVIKIEENLACSISCLVLRTKKKSDTHHVITLNNIIFKKDCQKDFSKLVNIFGVDEDNPITVTLPDIKSYTIFITVFYYSIYTLYIKGVCYFIIDLCFISYHNKNLLLLEKERPKMKNSTMISLCLIIRS